MRDEVKSKMKKEKWDMTNELMFAATSVFLQVQYAVFLSFASILSLLTQFREG